MTCKDCIHSGLCYKENDYENFPDRCGDFISDKVLEERPQGEWEKCQNGMFRCSKCRQADEVPTAMGAPIYNFCPNCGIKMGGGAE